MNIHITWKQFFKEILIATTAFEIIIINDMGPQSRSTRFIAQLKIGLLNIKGETLQWSKLSFLDEKAVLSKFAAIIANP